MQTVLVALFSIVQAFSIGVAGQEHTCLLQGANQLQTAPTVKEPLHSTPKLAEKDVAVPAVSAKETTELLQEGSHLKSVADRSKSSEGQTSVGKGDESKDVAKLRQAIATAKSKGVDHAVISKVEMKLEAILAKEAQDEQAAKTAQKEAARKAEEELAAKKAQEEQVAKIAQEEAAKKALIWKQRVQEELAAKKAQEEQVAKIAQEEAAKKAQEDLVAKKAQEEQEGNHLKSVAARSKSSEGQTSVGKGDESKGVKVAGEKDEVASSSAAFSDPPPPITAAEVPSSVVQVSKHDAGGTKPKWNYSDVMHMDKTKMEEEKLPPASKNINGHTVTADWEKEYYPLVVMDEKGGVWRRAIPSVLILVAAATLSV